MWAPCGADGDNPFGSKFFDLPFALCLWSMGYRASMAISTHGKSKGLFKWIDVYIWSLFFFMILYSVALAVNYYAKWGLPAFAIGICCWGCCGCCTIQGTYKECQEPGSTCLLPTEYIDFFEKSALALDESESATHSTASEAEA